MTTFSAAFPPLTAVALRDGQTLTFDRVRQDRRTYYRLLINGRAGGSLTDLTHALETIAYWRSKGWIADDSQPALSGAEYVRELEIPDPKLASPGPGEFSLTAPDETQPTNGSLF